MRSCEPPWMPMVVDQAVPSEVQSTVGSEWLVSEAVKARVVCPQVAPPSSDQYCAWWPLATMLFEAAITRSGLLKLMRMSDSLRAFEAVPEILRLVPTVALNSSGGTSFS